MTDELNRRLRDLVDDIEPAVLISPAQQTRRRGTRRRTRQRAVAGVAAAAAVGAITAGLLTLDGTGARGTAHGPASAGAMPTGTPAPVNCAFPPSTTASRQASDPSLPVPPNTNGPGLPVCWLPEGSANGPLSPRALTPADLPGVPGGWTQDDTNTGTWSGTAAESLQGPGVFCLSNAWSRPADPQAPQHVGLDAPAATPLLRTAYSFREGGTPAPGHASGGFVETVATFATEQDAQAAEAKLAAAADNCASRYPTASVTDVGDGTARLWKWDHAPDSYRGYEGFIRSGRTLVVIGYLQGGPFAADFGPQHLHTALDRATR